MGDDGRRIRGLRTSIACEGAVTATFSDLVEGDTAMGARGEDDTVNAAHFDLLRMGEGGLALMAGSWFWPRRVFVGSKVGDGKTNDMW
jgi:hypothetical protein